MMMCPDGKLRKFKPWGNMYEDDYKVESRIVDIGSRVELASEHLMPADPDRLILFESDKLICLTESGESLLVINPVDAAGELIDLRPIFGREPITHVALSACGRIAASTGGGKTLLVSRIDSTSETEIEKHTLGEKTSFGFNEEGRLLHLDHKGRIRRDGTALDFAYTIPDARKYGRKVRAAITRIQAAGNLLVVHDVWAVNRGYISYVLQQRTIDTGGQTPAIVNISKTASHHYDKLQDRLASLLLQNGHFAEVEYPAAATATRRGRPQNYDMHAKLTFKAGRAAHELGSVRVSMNMLMPQAITISSDRSRGFIGKRDGTIEYVDLTACPDGGRVNPHVPFQFSASLSEKNKALIIDGESVPIGDPHPYFARPEQIVQWQAHEGRVARLFTFRGENGQEQLCSIDEHGTLRLWRINL